MLLQAAPVLKTNVLFGRWFQKLLEIKNGLSFQISQEYLFVLGKHRKFELKSQFLQRSCCTYEACTFLQLMGVVPCLALQAATCKCKKKSER